MAATFEWRDADLARLIAAPALVLAAVVLLTVVPTTDRIQLVNPMARMGSDWVLAAFLSIPAPGLVGLARADDRTHRKAQGIAIGTSGAIALLIVAWIVPGVTQIGCRPIANALGAVPTTALVAVVAGLSFWVPSVIGKRLAEHGRVAAAFIGATIAAALGIVATSMTFLLAFPGPGCAPP